MAILQSWGPSVNLPKCILGTINGYQRFHPIGPRATWLTQNKQFLLTYKGIHYFFFPLPFFLLHCIILSQKVVNLQTSPLISLNEPGHSCVGSYTSWDGNHLQDLLGQKSCSPVESVVSHVFCFSEEWCLNRHGWAVSTATQQQLAAYFIASWGILDPVQIDITGIEGTQTIHLRLLLLPLWWTSSL